MARPSAHPRSFWERVVAEVRGGESPTSTARRYGVTLSAITYWRSKLRASPTFLPVVVPDAPPQMSGSAILEVAVDGVLLRFVQDVAPEYVGELVARLRSM